VRIVQLIGIIQYIMPFLALIAYLILMIAFVFFNFAAYSMEKSYFTTILTSFKIYFGTYEDSNQNSWAEWFYCIIFLILMPVVLQNMVISLMGNAFGEINDSFELNDCRQKLSMVDEVISIGIALVWVKNQCCRCCQKSGHQIHNAGSLDSWKAWRPRNENSLYLFFALSEKHGEEVSKEAAGLGFSILK